jgi:hypothetical protein
VADDTGVTSTFDDPTPDEEPDVPKLDNHSAGVADDASQIIPDLSTSLPLKGVPLHALP